MKRPKPWLRYIVASAVSHRLALDAMPVRNEDGDELGIVDGLVVDSESGRALYVVVDAGWFTVRHFLIPISQIGLDPSRHALRAPLSKEQIGRFPGFDVRRFDPLTKNEKSPEAVLESSSPAPHHLTRSPETTPEPFTTH